MNLFWYIYFLYVTLCIYIQLPIYPVNLYPVTFYITLFAFFVWREAIDDQKKKDWPLRHTFLYLCCPLTSNSATDERLGLFSGGAVYRRGEQLVGHEWARQSPAPRHGPRSPQDRAPGLQWPPAHASHAPHASHTTHASLATLAAPQQLHERTGPQPHAQLPCRTARTAGWVGVMSSCLIWNVTGVDKIRSSSLGHQLLKNSMSSLVVCLFCSILMSKIIVMSSASQNSFILLMKCSIISLKICLYSMKPWNTPSINKSLIYSFRFGFCKGWK